MPNYVITNNLQCAIIGEVGRLMKLRTGLVERDFPLTDAQVQTAIVPTTVLDHILALKEAGVESVKTSRVIYARLMGEGITRWALLEMITPERLYYMYDTQVSRYGLNLGNKLPFNLETLDAGTRVNLIKWVNAAVSEHRIAGGTLRVVMEFLDHCNSLAMLSERWPDLKIVFTKLYGQWPERMRDLPRSRRSNWEWPTEGPAYEWWKANHHKLGAAGQVIVGATVIDRPTETERLKPGVNATIIGWEGNYLLR